MTGCQGGEVSLGVARRRRSLNASRSVTSEPLMSEIGDIAALVTAVAAVVALVAGYVQFVLRRWLLPSVEFDVDYTYFCEDAGHAIGEVACLIKNAGSNMLVVTGVRCRMSYRLPGEGRWWREPVSDPGRPERLGRHEGEPIEPSFPHPVEPMASQSAWLLILPPPPEVPDVWLPYLSVSAPVGSSNTPGDPGTDSSNVRTSVSSGTPTSGPGGPVSRNEIAHPDYDRTFVQPGTTQIYRKPIVLPSGAQLIHVWGAFDYRIEMSWASKRLVGIVNTPPRDLDWRDGVENHTVRRTFKVAAT
jgi:hypothetical protein